VGRSEGEGEGERKGICRARTEWESSRVRLSGGISCITAVVVVVESCGLMRSWREREERGGSSLAFLSTTSHLAFFALPLYSTTTILPHPLIYPSTSSQLQQPSPPSAPTFPSTPFEVVNNISPAPVTTPGVLCSAFYTASSLGSFSRWGLVEPLALFWFVLVSSLSSSPLEAGSG
jgi:hypothetical protein